MKKKDKLKAYSGPNGVYFEPNNDNLDNPFEPPMTKIDMERSFTHERPEPDTNAPNLSIKKKYRVDSSYLYTVFTNNYEEGFSIGWEGDRGFGEIRFFQDKGSSQLSLNTESMSKEFVIAVLTKLVEDAILE